jgi:hypothetical protein
MKAWTNYILTLLVVLLSFGLLKSETGEEHVPSLELRTLDSNAVDNLLMDDRYIFGREELMREKRLRQADSWFQRWIDKLTGASRKKAGKNEAYALTFIDYLWMVIKYLLIVGAIVGIIYFMFKNQIQQVFRSQKDKSVKKVGQIQEDIRELDVEELLAEALKENDLKRAVRIQFLHVLKVLSTSGLITWKPHKTNRDYLYELKKKQLDRQFSEIAYTYEYVWYGDKQVSDSIYQETERIFRSFLAEVTQNKSK